MLNFLYLVACLYKKLQTEEFIIGITNKENLNQTSILSRVHSEITAI